MDPCIRWTDLPIDILSSISDRLGLIDLLSFRGTCKDFRSASSTSSAELKSSRSTPWQLIPDTESSNCIIYSVKGTTYNRNIPELKGATFLASYQGWLLLFKEGLVFFFSPFSLAKIVLPKYPYDEIDNELGHGAFSDVPTSPHCTVSIIGWREIILISKGQNAWTHHVVPQEECLFPPIPTATFDQRTQTFYYMDERNSLLTFSVKDMKRNTYPMKESLPYYDVCDTLQHLMMYGRDRFDVKDDEYVKVCGLTFNCPVTSRPLVYPNEIHFYSSSEHRVRRAVWIQPRFFEVDLKF